MSKQTFAQWMKKNLGEYLEDIASHGADAGYPHITYYTDTIKLYNRFEDEIWTALREDADDFGYKNPLELIAKFNTSADDDTTFKNLLVWYMVERTARQLIDY